MGTSQPKLSNDFLDFCLDLESAQLKYYITACEIMYDYSHQDIVLYPFSRTLLSFYKKLFLQNRSASCLFMEENLVRKVAYVDPNSVKI